jgi:bile acid:Na+ symporter, BASS family
MNRCNETLAAVSHFVHKNLLWLMLGSYATAALFPAAGLAIRDASIHGMGPLGVGTKISVSMIMLAALLLNAGLGVRRNQIRDMVRSPRILGLGMAANLVIPIAFIFVVSRFMSGWHNADEVQNILVGLALVASMPIAGSSTAWAQNADGEAALSLGLVLFSTLLSPLTTPVALHSVGLMAAGDYAEDLHELASAATGTFLVLGVITPALLGIALGWAVGEGRLKAARPGLKLINSIVLLLLNYSNASVSLPQAFADPDADFLAVTLAIVAGLCVLAFGAGWLISQLIGATPSQRTSIMFGLGMNNNGTGLVLASLALADHPRVMLPIIFYNLVQHLIAGVVDRFVCRAQLRRRPERLWVRCYGFLERLSEVQTQATPQRVAGVDARARAHK